MSIRVRCPRCWETAEVSEKDLGKQGICNSCGSAVTIPQRLTKVCFICGADVTHTRHAKDPDNNYLCQSCWQARNPVQRAMFSVPSLECAMCHARLAEADSHEYDGRTLCRDCLGRVRDRATAPATAADEAGRRERSAHPLDRVHDDRDDHRHGGGGEHHERVELHEHAVHGDDADPHRHLLRAILRRSAGSPLAVVLACLALAASAVLAVLRIGDAASAWEREHHAAIAALKAQAEILVSVGKVREGVEKYNELLRLVNGRRIRGEMLSRQIRAAQAAAEVASKTVVDTWEEEYRPRIMVLRGQAEVLSSLGRHREAGEKYGEILRLAGGRSLRSAVLAEEIRLARAGLEQEAQLAADAQRQAEMAAAVSGPREQPGGPVASANNHANPPATQPAPPQAVAGTGNGAGTSPARQPETQQPPAAQTDPQQQRPETPSKPPAKSIFDF